MNTTTTSTLATLATTRPAASRVFQRLGLDYCCGGRQALADACQAKGLDPDAVLSAIDVEEESTVLVRWDTAPLPDLIRFIVAQYHNPLRHELPALIDLAARVENRHAEKADCPQGLRSTLEALHGGMLDHMEKEERVVFPMILEGLGAGIGGPMQMLEEEHTETAGILNRIRQLTQDHTPPADACTSWRALYLRLQALEEEFHQHVHLENNVLFVRALEGREA